MLLYEAVEVEDTDTLSYVETTRAKVVLELWFVWGYRANFLKLKSVTHNVMFSWNMISSKIYCVLNLPKVDGEQVS